MTPQRIKEEARKYCKDEALGSREDCSYCIQDYIAGATAVNEALKPIIDAAEKVGKIFAHKGDHQTCAICQLAAALAKWKGEVEHG